MKENYLISGNLELSRDLSKESLEEAEQDQEGFSLALKQSKPKPLIDNTLLKPYMDQAKTAYL